MSFPSGRVAAVALAALVIGCTQEAARQFASASVMTDHYRWQDIPIPPTDDASPSSRIERARTVSSVVYTSPREISPPLGALSITEIGLDLADAVEALERRLSEGLQRNEAGVSTRLSLPDPADSLSALFAGGFPAVAPSGVESPPPARLPWRAKSPLSRGELGVER